MGRHFKIEELLSAAELEELDAFAREPGRTIDECHEWLQARGFTMSRSAVGAWKQEFDALVMQQRFGRSSELAKSIKEAVAKGSFDDVADAAVMQLTQVVFEQAARLEADGEIDPLDVMRMSRSLNNLVGSKAGLTKLLAEKFDREMSSRQEKRKGGALTAEDIEAARKAIFG